jgi:DNA-binding LacI/PurR family transcriptional regulator
MRQFRTQSSRPHRGTLALLAHHPQTRWSDPDLYFYGEILSGARSRAERLGFDTEVFCLSDAQISPKRLAGILRARGIRGVVALPLPVRTDTLHFPFEQFAAVKLGYMLQTPLLHRVTTDYVAHLSQVLFRIEQSGYERVGYVVDELVESRLARLAEAHFSLHQQHVPRAQRVPNYQGQLLGNPAGKERFIAWWEKYRPEVVVCQHLQPYLWLKEHGVRFPRDAGFAAITTRPGYPKASGMTTCLDEIGATAIDIVAHSVLHAEHGVPEFQRTVLLCGRWHEGSTLRKIRAAD